MTSPPRITFRRHHWSGQTFELEFAVDLPEPRIASALAHRGGNVSFPHGVAEAGQTLGDPDLDELLCDRARQVLALINASHAWSAYTNPRRRSRR